MKKRDKMKMMGILILLLAVITVAITLILVSRLSKTAGKDQKEETFDRSVSGMLSNAYILKSEEKDIIVLYRGETYFAEGKPEKKYTGVADIELTKGKVTKIYAKPSTIKGVLTRLTISGCLGSALTELLQHAATMWRWMERFCMKISFPRK